MTNTRFTNTTITSADGTSINFYSIGSGPGLVIVHGTFRSATDYEQLALSLSGSFTVYIPDRRGRGASGAQGDEYSLMKEKEDVDAVLKHTGSTFLFGHSFGGAVALEVALNNARVKKLAVYEPAVSIDNPLPVHLLPPIHAALANGQNEFAFVEVMKILSEGSIPESRLTKMAGAIIGSAMWPQFQRLLVTVPAEISAIHQTHGTYGRYRLLTVPTLLMYGANTQPSVVSDNKTLAGVIPVNKTAAINGAGHNGPDMEAPELVAEELKEWFK